MSRRDTRRAGALAAIVLLAVLGLLPTLGQGRQADSPPGQDQLAAGQHIYDTVCIACHQPGGVGIDGIYPALDGNPLVTLDDPTYVLSVVLSGRGGMPRMSWLFDDDEIAAVVSYIRQAWSNDASPVTADEVAAIRAAHEVPEATPAGQDPTGAVPATPDA